MTKVNYVITVDGKKAPSCEYVGYAEVNNVVKVLNRDAEGSGHHFGYVAKYTEFDPDDTPEKRAAAKERARKVAKSIKERGVVK